MLDSLDDMIRLTPFTAAAKRRLRACVPRLAAVLDEAPVGTAPWIVAASTPTQAACFAAERLPPPQYDHDGYRIGRADRSAAARALPSAIAAGNGDLLLHATAVLLGREGVADLADDWRDLTAQKQRPLMLILAGPGTRSLTTLITVTALPRRTLH